MWYIVFFLITSSYFFILSKAKFSSPYEKVLILIPLCFSLSFLPSWQMGVATDYESYVNVFSNELALGLYERKGEYLFVWLVSFLKYLDLPPQSLFVAISLIQTILLINIFRLLNNKEYNIVLLFILFYTMTNMLHAQMNILRAYVAVYCFLNAFFYRLFNKKTLSILFLLFGFYWHKSILLVSPFIFLPEKIYIFIFKHRVKLFFSFFVVYFSGIITKTLLIIVESAIPHYAHYITNQYGDIQVSFKNILSKLIYLPLGLIFLYSIKRKDHEYKNRDKVIISFWVVTNSLYLMLIHFYPISRIIHYTIFFIIVPVYYLLTRNYISSVFKALIILYCILPYLYKVLTADDNIFSYFPYFL